VLLANVEIYLKNCFGMKLEVADKSIFMLYEIFEQKKT
jgi:hypothetical protein